VSGISSEALTTVTAPEGAVDLGESLGVIGLAWVVMY
jgi:hypothetical protein